MASGIRINRFASAHVFPKFVKGVAEVEHELRKVGIRLECTNFGHRTMRGLVCLSRGSLGLLA